MKKYNAVIVISEDLETMRSLGLFDTREDAEKAIKGEKAVRSRLGSKHELHFTKVLEIEL